MIPHLTCTPPCFVVVIRYRWREDRLRSYVAPALIFLFLVGLALSIPFLFWEGYGYLAPWCWVAPNFQKCAQDGLSSQECLTRVWLRRDLMYFFPLWTCVGLTALIQFTIFWTINITERKAKKWRFSTQREDPPVPRPVSDRTSERFLAQRLRREQRRAVRAERRRNNSNRVAIQALMYLGSFLVCWIPFTITTNVNRGQAVNILTTNLNFWVTFMAALLQPLQGKQRGNTQS